MDAVRARLDPHLDRQLAFWFMLFTPVLFTMGLLMRHAIATDDAKLQSMLGWSMLGIGAFGAIAMPVSGFWAATIYKRAGTIAVTLVLVGLGALLVLWMYLVGRMDAWAEVFTWFATQGALGLALWGLLLGAALAGVSYLTLRRAVP